MASGADESARTAGATAVAPGDGRGGAPAAALGYDIGPGVERAAEVAPYERTPEDPPARPLRIFALDPSASSLEGAVAVVKVPFEPIASGFRGTLFEVSPRDGGNGLEYQPLDLDDRATLLGEGRAPSPSDPLFHQQMVYAVSSLVYAAFQAALGRQVAWARFGPPADSHPTRLRLSPYAARDENAYYDNEAGELRFGYFRAREAGAPGTPPRGWVFTSLSHDVVAHEVTHALLDGLRADLVVPTGPDVPAFHEGFADLVALLQRFRYPKVVEAAIEAEAGRLDGPGLLNGLARQFGQATGAGPDLRSAIDAGSGPARLVYRADLEPHRLGTVLLVAVFDAFRVVLARKVARLLRLAGRGSAPGELSPDLRTLLAEQASRLASQFLTVCIRGIDYCPPVDIELGEFLRAVVTADRELVPEDPWGYREAWVEAFRCREIYPPAVDFLTEDALLWRPPPRPVPPIERLSFARLQFAGDPGRPAGPEELRRQARALGEVVTRPENLEIFGLARTGDSRLEGDRVDRPCVQSIRSSRRVGPDGQVVFDLVAEVTQRRHVDARGDDPGFAFIGGATVIIGPRGEIRYVISKRVVNAERLARQRAYVRSPHGSRLWARQGARLVPAPQPFRLHHDAARGRPGAADG